jgi:hypothetical protein
MVWDPAIPATNADLLSAPVRDNFAALDTSVMGALGALATQQVLLRVSGPAIGGVAAGADGQVLTLASGVPIWQAAPTGGGAVGEWRWSTTTTSPAASQQMRLNGAHPYTTATTLWVSYVTTAGTDARIALLLTKPGQTLHIQDKSDSSLYVRLTVTTAPTDDAANSQVVLPVAWIANGNALLNNQNVLMVVGAAQSAATIIDAKGDLIVGTAPDTAMRLGIGTDGQVLTAEAAQATGVKWAAPTGMISPMTNIGDLIRGGTAGAPTRLAAVAVGQVLISQGVNTAPVWSVGPTVSGITLTNMTGGGILYAATSNKATSTSSNLLWDDANSNLKLFGGTIGTSGAGVLALGPATAPTTSPVDTVQLWGGDFAGEAGSSGLEVRTERGGRASLGSYSTGGTYFRMYDAAGTVGVDVLAGIAEVKIGSIANHPVQFLQNYVVRLILDTTGNINLTLPGLAARAMVYGAVDSGGAGYRMLRVAN